LGLRPARLFTFEPGHQLGTPKGMYRRSSTPVRPPNSAGLALRVAHDQRVDGPHLGKYLMAGGIALAGNNR
jgi:hypothetical protein